MRMLVVMWKKIISLKLRWLIIFVISIFIFAFIYWLLPESFYHSTTLYEPNTRLEYVQLREQIISDFKSRHYIENYPQFRFYTYDGKWLFDIDTVEINGINFNDDSVIISYGIYVIDSEDFESNEAEFKFTSHLVFFDVQYSKSYYYDGEYYILYGEIVSSDLINSSLPTIGFNVNDITLTFSDKTNYPYIGLYLSERTHNNLVTYNKLTLGLPRHDFTNLVRMFYLSTITITTLGFGDIVPLTTTARILVSVEAILGIVLLGLFVNDVLKERNKIKMDT